MFYDRAESRFGDGPGVVESKDSIEEDRFGNGASRCQGAKSHQTAQRKFSLWVDLQTMEDENWDARADEICECIKAKSDIAGCSMMSALASFFEFGK